ncbi:hypothetical protein NC99_27350 [Sunxiuqinia dokdonensis]|uniref:Uncharacterized protein n=1 Tax=Sunxiuqinia dokdonensis TaxID=1409788 RepID=A0A0L8V7Q3_9BACT|nr:hypothetical protein NC99_27350 [Sunxiuqinia dokdonensis]
MVLSELFTDLTCPTTGQQTKKKRNEAAMNRGIPLGRPAEAESLI